MSFASRQDLLLGVERKDGQHRPEDLVLDDLGVLGHVGHDRRLVERPRQARHDGPRTPGDDPRAGVSSPLHEPLDALQLALADEGPHVGRGIGRVAHPDGLRVALEAGQELLVDRPLDIDPRGRGAVLAGVDEAAGDRASGGRVEVGVVVHDERRLAAELEMHSLEVAAGERLDLPTRLGVTGQRDEVDVRMCRDCRPDLVAAPGDDVENAVRQPGLLRQLAEHERRERRDRGGLEDHRIAGRQSRPDLPDRHHERVVPGRDLADDPDRLTPDHARVRAAVLGGRFALEMANRRRKETQVVRAERNVRVATELEGRSRLGRLDVRDLGGVLIDEVGELVEDRHPLGDPFPAPAAVPEGRACRGDGPVDVGRGARRHPTDERASSRVADLDPRSAGRLDGRPVDPHAAVLGDLHGHGT